MWRLLGIKDVFSGSPQAPILLIILYQAISDILATVWLLKAFKFTALKEDTNLLNPCKPALLWETLVWKLQHMLGRHYWEYFCISIMLQTLDSYDEYEEYCHWSSDLIHYPPEGKLFTCITVHFKYSYWAPSIYSDTKEFHLKEFSGSTAIAPIKQQR